MQHLLHDAIDEMEAARDGATEIVDNVRKQTADVIGEAGDFHKGMEALAILVEDKLADLTTQTIKRMAKIGRKLRK